MQIRLALVVVALGVSLPTLLTAQEPLRLQPGQRVRVTAPSAGLDHTVGTVVEVRGRDIVLRPDSLAPGADTVTSVTLYLVSDLEVSLGRHRHFWAGVGFGAAAGAFFLGVEGLTIREPFRSLLGLPNPVAAAGIGAALGLVVGGVIGGQVGSNATEGWAEVPLGGHRLGLIVTPAGRVGLGASVSF